MTGAVLVFLAAAPCVYWTQGIETRAALESAGIKRICVPPDQGDPWRKAGFTVTAVSDADLAAREALPPPGVTARAGCCLPHSRPVDRRKRLALHALPGAKYSYDRTGGQRLAGRRGSFTYGADVVLKIDPSDVPAVGAMMAFFESLPSVDVPPVADFGVVDDGSAVTGEAINLMARRNLLFAIEKAPSDTVPPQRRRSGAPRSRARRPPTRARSLRKFARS